ncbi:MAG: restriction endonuclease [Verrucomicrobiae bacterium]|nr:restriction endonuclease [Verrucomicrobiae bacterium]
MLKLLPLEFDQLAASAVRRFWMMRSGANAGAQAGGRGAVIGGKNMDGFVDLVREVTRHCGFPQDSVFTRKSQVMMPGFFRATKNWDVVIVHRSRLLAVFESKSQVGSFGNNFNNRSEEVIGSAADLWVAHHHGAYSGRAPESPTPAMRAAEGEASPMLNPELQRDPRPPFLGWLMLLEECEGSLRPVGADEPHYAVFPEFRGASYARRYQILCERLVERRLYGAAGLVLSPRNSGGALGEHRSLSDATSLRTLFAEYAAKLAAAGS